MTRQPLSAKSAIAIDPTPPAAPVTSAAPADGVRSWRSIAISASIAVKPAVPLAIACARDRPGGRLTQPVAIPPRPFGIAAEMGLAEAISSEHDLVAGSKVRSARAL